ncbi:unnamed protein product [Penicillium salamii]|uniref:Major facilitator superfamily (MFS) profile domain-containing protein n=1 Tax=Penicillium salamii TaxID=1612424 RepID=A0A9W4K0S3_9EURO|nr:unnamed protein product [Penicillium salamii]CAG8149105.1 unnamed protein product [Penicillium salamii]CAG8150451.1 unnamed protein product [Penicillium salamii]CAG8168739.1 unnamed protein product [Penicillium salamii]CAG8339098.1 unnamed protein product [Penicillium salamii]
MLTISRNIGNAKTAGLATDLGLTDYQWSWVLYAFYISYIVFEWSTVLWKILPAHSYIAVLCIWQVLDQLFPSHENANGLLVGLLATRSLLGIFESVFGCGAPYFLSLFYQRKELGLRVSLLLGMSPVANCFASALAYGITHIRGSMESWRYLFIIVVYFYLPDSPGTAKFLTETEQTEAIERLQEIDTTAKNKVRWSQVLSGLKDYKNYVHMAIHFCCNYSFAGLSNFLPSIIQAMGYTLLCCVAAAFLSDRLANRGGLITFFAILGTIGYIMLTCMDETKTAARYAGIWLATCGIFPALALNVTWLLNNQGGESKKGAGMAILAIFGQCSSLISSSVFPDADAPLYTKGCAIGSALTGCIAILAVGLSISLSRENKRRDRLYGAVGDERVDVTDGDANVKFRYLI